MSLYDYIPLSFYFNFCLFFHLVAFILNFYLLFEWLYQLLCLLQLLFSLLTELCSLLFLLYFYLMQDSFLMKLFPTLLSSEHPSQIVRPFILIECNSSTRLWSFLIFMLISIVFAHETNFYNNNPYNIICHYYFILY